MSIDTRMRSQGFRVVHFNPNAAKRDQYVCLHPEEDLREIENVKGHGLNYAPHHNNSVVYAHFMVSCSNCEGIWYLEPIVGHITNTEQAEAVFAENATVGTGRGYWQGQVIPGVGKVIKAEEQKEMPDLKPMVTTFEALGLQFNQTLKEVDSPLIECDHPKEFHDDWEWKTIDSGSTQKVKCGKCQGVWIVGNKPYEQNEMNQAHHPDACMFKGGCDLCSTTNIPLNDYGPYGLSFRVPSGVSDNPVKDLRTIYDFYSSDQCGEIKGSECADRIFELLPEVLGKIEDLENRNEDLRKVMGTMALDFEAQNKELDLKRHDAVCKVGALQKAYKEMSSGGGDDWQPCHVDRIQELKDQNNHCQANLLKKEDRIANQRKQITGVEALRAEDRAQIKDLFSQLRKKQEHNPSLQTQLDHTKQKLVDLAQEFGKKEQEFKRGKTEIIDLGLRNDSLNQHNTDLQSIVDELKAEIKQAKFDIFKLGQTKRDFEGPAESYEIIKELMAQVIEHRNSYHDQRTKCMNLQQNYDRLQRRQQDIKNVEKANLAKGEEFKRLRKEMSELQNSNTCYAVDLRDSQQEVEELSEACTVGKKLVAKYAAEIDDLEIQVSELQALVDEKTLKVASWTESSNDFRLKLYYSEDDLRCTKEILERETEETKRLRGVCDDLDVMVGNMQSNHDDTRISRDKGRKESERLRNVIEVLKKEFQSAGSDLSEVWDLLDEARKLARAALQNDTLHLSSRVKDVFLSISELSKSLKYHKVVLKEGV